MQSKKFLSVFAFLVMPFVGHASVHEVSCLDLIFSSTHDAKRVDQNDVQTNIEKILERRLGVPNSHGFFGPSSMMWELNRIPFLMLFAAPELYMQLAHPPSAQGVVDYSQRLKKDPIRRFQSTFFDIWGIVFGTVEEASMLALRLSRIHGKITGTLPTDAGSYKAGYQYSANDPFALLWIHATHWYAVLRTYEVFVRTLTDAERNVYIGETKIFAMLLGIPENMIPSNWSEFKTYFDTMVSSPELTYSRDARALEQHFRVMSREVERKNPAVWIARKYSDAITASTLPKKLAEQFDFERSRTKNALYVAALSALRFSYPLIPRWGGELPLYRMAMARARGAAPDPKDELLYKAFMGRANFYQFAQEAAKIALKR